MNTHVTIYAVHACNRDCLKGLGGVRKEQEDKE
jgi:hypothetical protein